MKQRYSSLDVRVITRELASEVVNLRVSNVYDLSSRIFLFKLAKPDHRRQLIIDSGFRCHVTHYSRTTATTPSHFVSRLRKALKSRRITSVEQIGTDRIIHFAFSDGMYHLFLEFFAGGNIILTDREYNIVALFRTVSAGEQQEEVKLGLKYTVSNKQNYGGIPEITTERISGTLEKARESFSKEGNAPKKSKKKGVDVLRKALSQGFPEYPPLLLDHAFAVRRVDSATPLEEVLGDEGRLKEVFGVLEEAAGVNGRLSEGDVHPGFIVAKSDTRAAAEPVEPAVGGEHRPNKPALLYEDFHPFKPRQFEGKPDITILEFERFNATVDEYFSSLESQRLESRLTEREDAAKRKLDTAKQGHLKRLGELEKTQELHIRKASAIQDNVYRVQEAMDAVNGLIAQGMDWQEMGRLVEMEQARGNPVAKIIKLPLKLHENTITLLLGEAGDEQDEDEKIFTSDESESESDEDEEEKEAAEDARKQADMFTVDIDLGLSPWANATQYYDQKKLAAAKQEKTAQSSTQALKSHEKKVTQDLKKGLKQEKQVLRPARATFWFEKFLFFVSSEGYLVLGGRDAMQNETLYRRYLKKGDVFVTADLDGATPMIIKNIPNAPDTTPIPPSTLSQAGNLCVATSSAWDSKAIMSAYWVDASQVGKIGPGGIVPTGEFVIKGTKNFLAPSQLVLGFGVMWQVSKESLKKNHRSGRFDVYSVDGVSGQEQSAEVIEDVDGQEKESVPVVAEPHPEPGKEQEEEQGQEQESPSDEEDADQLPAKNPLQRGASELQTTNEAAEASDEQKSEEKSEDEEKGDNDEPEESQEAHEAPHEEEEEDQQLSSRERRALRKGQQSPDPSVPAKGASKQKQYTKQPTKAPPMRGGKKAKSKKAAAKYADQDDEDRELALRVLGGKSAKTEKAEKAAAAREARDREAEATKQRRKAQHERAAAAEKKRQAIFEAGGGGDEYDEETAKVEAADLSWIPALVGTPHHEDEIIAAVPVCAPWAALGRYKYRVKIQPGSVKKGKAVKEIVGRWVSETTTGKVKKEQAEDAGISLGEAEKLRAREGELIKTWKDTEIVNTMPVGKVRIMGAAGGSGEKGKGGGGDKGKGKGGGGGNAKTGKGSKKK